MAHQPDRRSARQRARERVEASAVGKALLTSALLCRKCWRVLTGGGQRWRIYLLVILLGALVVNAVLLVCGLRGPEELYTLQKKAVLAGIVGPDEGLLGLPQTLASEPLGLATAGPTYVDGSASADDESAPSLTEEADLEYARAAATPHDPSSLSLTFPPQLHDGGFVEPFPLPAVPSPTSRSLPGRSPASPRRRRSRASSEYEEIQPRVALQQHCTLCSVLNVNTIVPPSMKSGATGHAEEILILSVGDLRHYVPGGRYHTNWVSWGCYGKRWSSPVRVVDPKTVAGCPRGGDWFFRRLCAQAVILEMLAAVKSANGSSRVLRELQLARAPSWVLHIDGDTVPFNGGLGPGDVVQRTWGRDVVLYERFRSGEITAGNWLLRVSLLAGAFLRQWEALKELASRVPLSNGDNGALQLHLVSYLREELAVGSVQGENPAAFVEKVRERYTQSSNLPSYDRYLAAAKLALGSKRLFKHVLILRRAHGFCLDNDIEGVDILKFSGGAASRFLCVHGASSKGKEALTNAVGSACVEAVATCADSLMGCGGNLQSEADLNRTIQSYPAGRLGLGGINDIASCWPTCPLNIESQTWAKMSIALRANADCTSPTTTCCCESPGPVTQSRRAPPPPTLAKVPRDARGADIAGTRHPSSRAAASSSGLFSFLRRLLKHRAKLGCHQVDLKSASDAPALSEAFQKDFERLALPEPGWALAAIGHACGQGGQPHRVVLDMGADGQWPHRLRSAWPSLPPGAVWAAAVGADDTIEQFEQGVFPLMYQLNCVSMEHERRHPPPFTCATQPLRDLFAVSFVAGFVLVERDDAMANRKFATGELMAEVQKVKPQSDKFETARHDYQHLYEKYLPPILHALQEGHLASDTAMLEIGLGCNMDYGPGHSALLWRRYFGPKLQLQYVEVDARCVEKWRTHLESLAIKVHVGPQEADRVVASIIASTPPGGFRIIIDDGGHHNHQIVKSLDALFPKIAEDGFYFVEDFGDPAFIEWAYPDGEFIHSLGQIQRKRTALAHILRTYAKALVLGPKVEQAPQAKGLAFIDCRKNMCALAKSLALT